MSQAQPVSKLQTAALVVLVFSAVLALGSALDLRNTLYILGHLEESGSNPLQTFTMITGTVFFPWVTILSALVALGFKKVFAPIAAAATLLGLTIQLLGTLYSTVTHSGFRVWEFRYEVLGVYTNEYIGLNDWIAGLVSKFGAYAAMAASVVILIQFLRSRSKGTPVATPGFAPAAAPAAPSQAIVGYDTNTGAPIYSDAK